MPQSATAVGDAQSDHLPVSKREMYVGLLRSDDKEKKIAGIERKAPSVNNADQIALYLASCIAATAHDFDKKSAPKGERMRHRRLCETAADVISGRAHLPRATGRHSKYDEKDVVERLIKMAAVLRQYEDAEHSK